MARDTATIVPFIDGTKAARSQNSTVDSDLVIVPQTALRTNGAPVELDNPLPVRHAGASLLASAAIEASHNFGTGDVYSISVSAIDANAWLLIFDAADIPPDGAVAPLDAIRSSSPGIARSTWSNGAVAFQDGAVAVLSSTGPLTKTTGPVGFFSALMK